MDGKDDSKEMTVEEVATYLKCSKSAVYQWADQGKIEHYRVGTLLRFTTQAVENFKRHVPVQAK